MSQYPLEKGQKLQLPLSLFRVSGDQVYISGHGAVDENGQYVGNDFESQFRYTMGTLKKTMDAAGVGYEDITMVRGYVQNPANLPLYNRIYREYFTEPYPARTTLTNCLPEGLEFEIDCVAVRKS